jgi:hypothetical protein
MKNQGITLTSKFKVLNKKTGEVVTTGNPLSVVHHLQKQQKGILDISIDLYEAFNKSYKVIEII